MSNKLNNLKRAIKKICNSAALVYNGYAESINELAKIKDAENRLAAVAGGYEFVFAFRPTARSLAASKTTPTTENYMALIEEAILMLVIGYEPNDVLCYFEAMLANERRR